MELKFQQQTNVKGSFLDGVVRNSNYYTRLDTGLINTPSKKIQLECKNY